MRVGSNRLKQWHFAATPLAGIALCAAAGVPALAQTLPSGLTTFANYSGDRSSAQSFEYTDTFGSVGTPAATTATGTFSVVSATPVNFNFQVPSGYNNDQASVPAFLTFTGTAVGAASATTGIVSQTIENLTATFTAVTPDIATGKSNLLTLHFNSGIFFFDAGAGAATLLASDVQATAGPPGIGAYSSDFLDFNNPTAANQYYKSEQFSIALSAVNSPAGSGNPGPTVDANGALESFAADSTGTFSSNPAPAAIGTNVPDASSLVLAVFGLGIAAVGYVPRRRRRVGN